MPFIQVTFIEGRTKEQKELLIEELSKTVSSVLEAPLETVRVCLNEIPSSHWGIAGKSIQRRQNEE
ncbi:4-oxalocrotonate tautomerase [Lysinibacillus sphaericus]|uniref:Tautomerase n=3 Tax=Lysinibacillus TaxID=400634 RepID=A0A2S0JX00_LYSSH|nr:MULTISPECIES: 2-hydroxymuconate tautomerase family protein [Lysinibacillus]AHN23215.1 4-oxalocrotonate tautomerase [Lysinibacillus varians]AVK95494.1 4-oxalocrotonate tautomerase [Lysinibacillus sphaericus]MCS1384170.1 2-hydroxymuconate tautomerase family protein [Lysinibacillus sphaericus]MED4546139.1 2-hydroxymuconate tautomerase family protein [Lysinibacillus sphaericus]TKI16979.1 4-oxalocrotonate tautomerase [Lysinibacillus sphaericus]